GGVEPRKSIIRMVVFGQMKISEGESGRRAETHHQGRRDAKAVVLDDVPVGDAVLVCHHIEPQRRSLAEIGERLIDVGCQPLRLIRSEHQYPVRKRSKGWQLAVLLNDATSGTAPEQDRGRPL